MASAQTAESTARPGICTCSSNPIMSVRDAAAVLGRSREYLYAGLREGRFPGTKFGRARGLSRAFVKSFIAEVIETGRPITFDEYATQWLSKASKARS
jgi:excisionase family DNA binding protein